MILAVDIGKHYGVAVGKAGEMPSLFSGTLDSDKTEAFGTLFHKINAFARKYKPETIVWEEPVPNGGKGGMFTIERMMGYSAVIHIVSHIAKPTNSASWMASTVRKRVMGDGRGGAKKHQVIAFCEACGLLVQNDHEADAAMVWICAQQEFYPDTVDGTFGRLL